MAFFILTRFVPVKYSCAFVARYFLLGLATHYRETPNFGSFSAPEKLVTLIKTFKTGISTVITKCKLGWFSNGWSHVHNFTDKHNRYRLHIYS